MIKVDGLTKYYGATLAVDSVSFEVQRGEVVGFLGPNGAGKTTTMRMITCYLKPSAGSVNVAGYDIQESPLEVRRRIGYLPENCPLYPEMNVLDYLNYIAELRQAPKSQRQNQVRRMVELTGLGSVTHKDIGELSKGYRQRVGLAQAMVHEPDILVLDEPTSGLDPNQIIEIRQLIRDIGREKTIILSTHILPEVSATCGRVLIINNARLVASGTPEELAASSSGAEVLHAVLKGPEDEVYAKLREADFISSFRRVEGDAAESAQGWLALEINSQSGDIRDRLFRLVVDKGWLLREMHRERMSLEEVFTRITTA